MIFVRLCLFVAILASAGVIALSEMKLKPLLDEVRDKETKAKEETKKVADESKKQKDRADKAEQDRDAAKSEVETAKKAEDDAKKAAMAEQEKAMMAAAEAAKAKAETAAERKKTEAFDEVKAKGLTPSVILAEHDELPKRKEELSTLKLEQKVINVQLMKTSGDLNALINPKGAVALPSLEGKVTAVDPKWDFVVLDIGANHGLLRNGELSIAREGRLIARVKATKVETLYAIANVMPGFKVGEIREGDSVLTPSPTVLPANKR